MSAPELVDAAGYISDESDFYGDEKMQKKLEREVKKSTKRPRDVTETPFTKAMAKRIKLDSESPALPTPSPTPEVRPKPPMTMLDFLKSRPQVAAMQDPRVNALHPLDGPPTPPEETKDTDLVPATTHYDAASSWQWSEPILAFLRRCPVTDPQTQTRSGWLWVQNPKIQYSHSKHQEKEDLPTFKERGNNLLEVFMTKKAACEKAFPTHQPGSITRKMGIERAKLETDIRSLAIETHVTCGKWLLFATESDVARVWRLVAEATATGKLGHTSKVATFDSSSPTRVICVYTYDFTDQEDVRRVLDGLVELDLVSRDSSKGIYYKCDAWTYLQLNSGNEYKIKASMYGSGEMLGAPPKSKAAKKSTEPATKPGKKAADSTDKGGTLDGFLF
ncbi:hypothetical protein LTR15_003644 [Elasticomyces elasticus]|nr:hypothetical protein LTR15_003644 [Elasticomyces elasticus]